MTTPNRHGPQGTADALRASNPALIPPDATSVLARHEHTLADHDARISALETGSPPGGEDVGEEDKP